MKLDGETGRLGGRFFYCVCYESEANKRKKRLLASFIQSSPTRKRSDKRNKAIARIFYTIEPDTKAKRTSATKRLLASFIQSSPTRKDPQGLNLAGLLIPSFYPFLFKNNASIFKPFRDFRSCKCCIRTIYENANLYYLSL